MPYVIVETVKGILDNDEKKLLLDRITDVLVEIEGKGNPAFRKEVWVKIDEQEPHHWMRGGLVPTAERITALFGKLEPDGSRKR